MWVYGDIVIRTEPLRGIRGAIRCAGCESEPDESEPTRTRHWEGGGGDSVCVGWGAVRLKHTFLLLSLYADSMAMEQMAGPPPEVISAEARERGARIFEQYHPLSTEEAFCEISKADVEAVGGRAAWIRVFQRCGWHRRVLGRVRLWLCVARVAPSSPPCPSWHQLSADCALVCLCSSWCRFYELFANDPLLGRLFNYTDKDVPRDPKVHGKRFALWLLARHGGDREYMQWRACAGCAPQV